MKRSKKGLRELDLRIRDFEDTMTKVRVEQRKGYTCPGRRKMK